jgi:hypothetical protein
LRFARQFEQQVVQGTIGSADGPEWRQFLGQPSAILIFQTEADFGSRVKV